jgi:hypothetical protein
MFFQEQSMFKNDLEFSEFLDLLADLSLNGESFEICLAALKLQTYLKEFYGNPL